MNISAINVNNPKFKGYDDVIDVPFHTVKDQAKGFDKLDCVDFNSIADTIGNGHDVEKHTSPLRFFLISSAFALAAFVTFRAGAMGTMKSLDNKFGLLNKPCEFLGKQISKFNKNHPKIAEKSVKAFVLNNTREVVGKILKFGIKGANIQELNVAKGITPAGIYTKNALHKSTATMLGAGAAGLTVASRYKDADGNGIPDKAEKILGTTKEIIEVIPAIASAINLS